MGSLLAASAVILCASRVSADPIRRPRNTVRVDQTGHLVRSVVVAPRPVDKKPEAIIVTAPDSKLNEIVEAAAKQYDVDPLLVHSVIQVESNYQTNAISPKGALGLMQLIPATARRFGATNVFDPKENIEAGVKYLKYLGEKFSEDLALALAAYNAGEGAVQKYKNSIPPYRETEQYVQNVGRRYGNARKAADKKTQIAKAVEAPTIPPEEKHPPVESFVDAEGRLNLRTKPADVENKTP